MAGGRLGERNGVRRIELLEGERLMPVDRAKPESNRPAEEWAVENKRMVLAPLSARVESRGERAQKGRFKELPAISSSLMFGSTEARPVSR